MQSSCLGLAIAPESWTSHFTELKQSYKIFLMLFFPFNSEPLNYQFSMIFLKQGLKCFLFFFNLNIYVNLNIVFMAHFNFKKKSGILICILQSE